MPRWAFEPDAVIVPPIANEGSAPQACNATANIDDVVVFPWVPATAMLVDSDIKIESAAARVNTVTPSSCARMSSGLLDEIAVEKTTRSAPSTFSAACDVAIDAPNATRAFTTEESLLSEPLTCIECDSAIRAKPLMPAPPIPIKCTRFPIRDFKVGLIVWQSQTRQVRRFFRPPLNQGRIHPRVLLQSS